MKRFQIIDGHCDTLTKLLDKSITLNDPTNHISLHKMIEGGIRVQFFATWIGSEEVYGSPLQRGLKLIDRYDAMLMEHPNTIVPILAYQDLHSIGDNQLGTLLTVEGGDILEGEIANLRILHRLGVRLMTLTWNKQNEISDSIMDTTNNGLSDFGILVVHEMNRLNMIIDVSHISVKGFWDVMQYSCEPIIASHSNAKALCSHPRNLDNDQIRAIEESKGVIGINFYVPFLTRGIGAIDDIIKHIEYIAGLGGIDIVGFGSDFDGIDQLPHDIEGPHHFPRIIEKLLQLNYSEKDVNKISSGNFLRVMKAIIS